MNLQKVSSDGKCFFMNVEEIPYKSFGGGGCYLNVKIIIYLFLIFYLLG